MDEKWNVGGVIVEIAAILVRSWCKRVQREVKRGKQKPMIVASRTTQSGCCGSIFRGMIREFKKSQIVDRFMPRFRERRWQRFISKRVTIRVLRKHCTTCEDSPSKLKWHSSKMWKNSEENNFQWNSTQKQGDGRMFAWNEMKTRDQEIKQSNLNWSNSVVSVIWSWREEWKWRESRWTEFIQIYVTSM
jgi:hypothetical protein